MGLIGVRCEGLSVRHLSYFINSNRNLFDWLVLPPQAPYCC